MDLHAVIGRAPAAAGNVRVLHPLDLRTGPTGSSDVRGPHVGVAVDVETTGLSAAKDRIIEMSARRFRYDARGIITHIDEPYEWREDPGEPLAPEITALTGLTDDLLAGCRIDDSTATTLLRSASFVVAHNATFDRPFVENRLSEATGLRWCCSMRQVDWRARGFDGRVLGYILLQSGNYHSGHRASADVDALIQMLRHEDESGRTALSELIETGARPSWIVRARGAHFDLKDDLRARGYRWDATDNVRSWWVEVSDDQLVHEQFWLASNVYSSTARPKAMCPEILRVTPRTRFL